MPFIRSEYMGVLAVRPASLELAVQWRTPPQGHCVLTQPPARREARQERDSQITIHLVDFRCHQNRPELGSWRGAGWGAESRGRCSGAQSQVAREGVCCDVGAAACAVGEPSVSAPRRVPSAEEASGRAGVAGRRAAGPGEPVRTETLQEEPITQGLLGPGEGVGFILTSAGRVLERG